VGEDDSNISPIADFRVAGESATGVQAIPRIGSIIDSKLVFQEIRIKQCITVQSFDREMYMIDKSYLNPHSTPNPTVSLKLCQKMKVMESDEARTPQQE
jgi:hypothetical protein